MKIATHALLVTFCLTAFSACATHRAEKIVPTPIHQAQEEIPEEQLLDVGILVFQTEELSPQEAQEEGEPCVV